MFTRHAIMQMQRRGIPLADAEAVVTRPAKKAPGHRGCTNYWGYGPISGYRIRVTRAANGKVLTVAWADSRKKGADG